MNRRALALALLTLTVAGLRVASAADDPPAIGAAVYTVDGELRLPQGYREWVFIGAPLTPNALNG
ncbi:MAG: cytochrome P460, partial [Pseudomonadota bacterium]|nr:cytochrome P460 [Pseudomonadota bacterium]